MKKLIITVCVLLSLNVTVFAAQDEVKESSAKPMAMDQFTLDFSEINLMDVKQSDLDAQMDKLLKLKLEVDGKKNTKKTSIVDSKIDENIDVKIDGKSLIDQERELEAQVKKLTELKQNLKVVKAELATELIVESAKPVEIKPVEANSPIESPSNALRYDFDCQNTKISDTLYMIAKRAGKDIVINTKLEGTVLTSLNGKTVEESLNVLSKGFNFNWMIDGDIIVVSPADIMLQNKRFVLKYANLKMVKDELIGIGIIEKNITINPEYNAVSLTATPYLLSQAEQRVNALDKPVEQLLIVAQMVEVNHADALKLGFNYNLPSFDSAATMGSGGTSTSSTLTYSVVSNANKVFSKGVVLARPSVVTQNGVEANLSMGDQIPIMTRTSSTSTTDISVTYKDVGNKLKVTPVVNDLNNKIVSLNVEAEVSSIAKWITLASNITAPQISTKNAKTVGRVKSGDTLVIGGLMTQSDFENLAGIPGLMDLPLLGKMFQYKEKSKDKAEIFILITPYLLKDGQSVESMKNLMTYN